MRQHYLVKEETQKAVHWCFVRATQSNYCSADDFLSAEPCRQSPSWMHWLQDWGSHTAVVVSRESKRLKKSSSDWLNSGNALIQRVKNAIFVFPVLSCSAEAHVIWGGILKRLLIACFIGDISVKKISKSIHVHQNYSTPEVGLFLRHVVHWFCFFVRTSLRWAYISYWA